MSGPTDKIRVIRLIKKPQKPRADEPAQPPSESAPERPAGQTRREARPPQRGGQFRGKKKPFQKRQGPRRQPAPREPKPAPVVLTNEQRSIIVERYRSMVVAGERPPEGRRNKIAAMLGIPYAKVAEVVRGYLTHERYRRTNFEIEKAYSQAVRAGQTDARAIAKQIAEALNLDEGRIWWWLEKLHEPRKAFARDAAVEEEKRSAILAAYESYLQRPDPPERGLHQTFAEQIGGVTPRQVHKVLWEYRMSVWSSLQNTVSETAPESPAPDQTE